MDSVKQEVMCSHGSLLGFQFLQKKQTKDFVNDAHLKNEENVEEIEVRSL
jgi:hypothetical protein